MLFFIWDYIPPIEGEANQRDGHEARWNGWACPYFTKEQADRVMAAHIACHGEGFAFFDDRPHIRAYVFHHPESDEPDMYEARMLDGREVWDIGAWGWTWQSYEGGPWEETGTSSDDAECFELRSVDDETVTVSLSTFFDCNEMAPENEFQIRSLAMGETFKGGGGAQPEWSIKRVS